jgi:Flp pilus assembly protein TadG
MTHPSSRTLPETRASSRFKRDIRGIAAVEFALLLPLMLTIYLGCAELTQGLEATRKSTMVASALSDLVAEQSSGAALTDSQVTDVFSAASAIVSPFQTNTLKMTISSVEFITDGKAATGFDAKIRWTITSNGGTARPCQIMTAAANSSNPTSTTIPTGIYPTSGSSQATTIIGDVTYVYTPSFGTSLLAWSSKATSMTFVHAAYMRPRNQYSITYSGSKGKVCASY